MTEQPQDGAHKRQNTLTYIVEPSSTHTHTFLFLHGLGSNGEKFGRELLESGIDSGGRNLVQEFPGTRFIFPTSKRRRSTAFGRSMLTQWFDIASLDDPSYRSYTQPQGLEESFQDIMKLLKAEADVVGSQNIVLGGLSQGCAMSLICLLALDFPVCAFVGMSGWLPFRHDIEDILESSGKDSDDDNDFFGSDSENPFASDNDETSVQDPVIKTFRYARDLVSQDDDSALSLEKSALTTPIFIGHGAADEKIKPSLGEDICKTMRSLGYRVSWRRYEEQGHWYKVPDEIDDLVEFLKENMVN